MDLCIANLNRYRAKLMNKNRAWDTFIANHLTIKDHSDFAKLDNAVMNDNLPIAEVEEIMNQFLATSTTLLSTYLADLQAFQQNILRTVQAWDTFRHDPANTFAVNLPECDEVTVKINTENLSFYKLHQTIVAFKNKVQFELDKQAAAQKLAKKQQPKADATETELFNAELVLELEKFKRRCTTMQQADMQRWLADFKEYEAKWLMDLDAFKVLDFWINYPDGVIPTVKDKLTLWQGQVAYYTEELIKAAKQAMSTTKAVFFDRGLHDSLK